MFIMVDNNVTETSPWRELLTHTMTNMLAFTIVAPVTFHQLTTQTFYTQGHVVEHALATTDQW